MKTSKLTKILGALALLLLLWVAHSWVKSYYFEEQVDLQTIRVESYKHGLETALGRYDYLPYVLSENDKLFNLAFTKPAQANQLLEGFKKNSLVDVIFIMDQSGKTISSSNWQQENSFVGKNYGYRPYFKQAMNQQKGQFFGVGATTSIPGYFVSAPYMSEGRVKAVIVVKILLSSIENDWSDSGFDEEIVFATDENEVIILSSQRKWLYYVLRSLNPEQLGAIKEQKQFGSNPQTKLDIKKNHSSPNLVKIDNQSYTQSLSNADVMNWKIHYLVPYTNISDQLMLFWSRILMVLLIGLAGFLMFRIVNNRIALRQSQGESLSLRQLNNTLHHEIEERKQIEKKLREAQVELRRTSKLAAMGQLSASITHELGQPLSAMTAYIASMKVSQAQDSPNQSDSGGTLVKLDKLVDRMTSISQQLRFFARSGEKETRPLDLREVISDAINTVQPSIQEADINLDMSMSQGDSIIVKAGRIRLEQVVVNLIKNAIEAIQEQGDNNVDKDKVIRLKLYHTDTKAILKIEDNGPGVTESVKKQLFEPFVTTKASGVGMGLGLAISINIIGELEGSLTVDNLEEGGACFTITLPLYANK